MPDIFVYRNDQPGAPVLSSANNSLCSLLYACLVTGFGSSTATSLTRVGNVATLAFSSAHSFKVGDPVQVDGATPAAYNGKWAVTAITGNTVSFAITGAPATPATGTLTCKIAPAGWTRPFVSGDVSVFRSSDVTGSQRYLRVDDSGTTSAQNFNKADCSMYESMTSVSVGVLSGTRPWPKVYVGETSTKWVLIASGKAFYILSAKYPTGGVASGTEPSGSFLNLYAFFGDINSFKSGDTFNCLLTSGTDAVISSDAAVYLAGTSNLVCRDYTLSGSSTPVNGRSFDPLSVYENLTGLNPADSAVHFVTPRLLVENFGAGGDVARGVLPGHVTSLTAYASLVLGKTTYTNIASGRWEQFDNVLINGTLRSVMLFCVATGTTKGFGIDITGPW